jgi:hypothetical protein
MSFMNNKRNIHSIACVLCKALEVTFHAFRLEVILWESEYKYDLVGTNPCLLYNA